MELNESSPVDACVENCTANNSIVGWELPALPHGTVVTLSTVFAVGVGLSATSNLVVACALIAGSRKKRSFNVFLLNLAGADWTLSTICVPFLFESALTGEWKFGGLTCVIVPFIFKVSKIVSVFSLVAIGIDRYRAVMYPLFPSITPRKKCVVIFFIWCLAVILSCPKLKYLKMLQVPYKGEILHFCIEKWPNRRLMVVYVWGMFVLTYFVPMVILTVCYVRMGIRLVKGQLPGCANERRDKLQKKAKRKAFRTLISVIILFAVCWLPINLYNIVIISYNIRFLKTHPLLIRTLRACVYIWVISYGAVVNPFVYMFLSNKFARDIKRIKIFCLKRMGRNYTCELSSSTTNRTTLINSHAMQSLKKRGPITSS
ncbi:prolactin-releasing peptide receptor-like [Ptychodera flava]|uniref:prolactin-releasing peptide receptor-like n=1 Tax=Ptychodera flava TaxID=63121 RepID=UPI00396A54D4